MESVTGNFQYVDTHEAVEFHDQHGAFGFTSSSRDAYSCYQNTNTLCEAYGEQLSHTDSLGGPVLFPNIFSYYGSSSHAVETPVTCFAGDPTDFCNSFQKASFMSRNSSFHFAEQHNAAIVQPQVQVSSNTKLLSISHCPENSRAAYLKTNSCFNSIVNLLTVEQDSPSSSKFALHHSMPRARSSEIVKACIYGAEKLPLPTATQLCDNQSEHVTDDGTVQNNESLLGVRSVSSGLVEGDNGMITESSGKQVENSILTAVNSLVLEGDRKGNFSMSPMQLLSDIDLFDGMELDMRPNNFVHELWDDMTMPAGRTSSCSNMSAGTSDCISVMEMGLIPGADKGLFSESGLQQLLDSIVGDHVNKASAHGSGAKYVHPVSGINLENQFSASSGGPSVYRNQLPAVGLPSINSTSGVLMPYCNSDVIHGSPKQALSHSNIGSWVDDSCSINTENSVLNQPKKSEEAAKVVKKRAKPGESTRPRPKDRQQIQDRLKELREIVPNGAKCSIDALLDKTIKHMLFLQSVTKYADKLKQTDEPKIIGEESGVVLKDNSGGVRGGGATWAYEVAGQTMVCPIIVEDLTPPGQMLVEMLCEDRGLFLEIADIIRGFGLIILKGVMEIRERKIWARFLVEANREVTRMDIFLSLVQLLQQNSCLRSADLATTVTDKGSPVFPGYHQSPMVSSS